MTKSSFTDFYKSLLDLVKTFEGKNVVLKIDKDLKLNIIRIIGDGMDSVSLAKNGLEEVAELSYTSAEHHPYWALLYNCSQISKTILEKWDDELTEEDLNEIRWMISELENSCNKLKNKIVDQDSRDK